jgi:hypothetical protein
VIVSNDRAGEAKPCVRTIGAFLSAGLEQDGSGGFVFTVTVLVSIPQGLTLLRRKSANGSVQVMLFWGGGFKLPRCTAGGILLLGQSASEDLPQPRVSLCVLYSRFRGVYDGSLLGGTVQTDSVASSRRSATSAGVSST